MQKTPFKNVVFINHLNFYTRKFYSGDYTAGLLAFPTVDGLPIPAYGDSGKEVVNSVCLRLLGLQLRVQPPTFTGFPINLRILHPGKTVYQQSVKRTIV